MRWRLQTVVNKRGFYLQVERVKPMLYPSQNRLKRCSSRCSATGLTLIEVIVSVGLLAALLVTTLSIRSQHIRQINLAYQKKTAVELLDRQLAVWFSPENSIPVNESGGFDDNPDYRWRASEIRGRNSNPEWNTSTVRIEVVSNQSEDVITQLDLIVSPKEEEGSQR